MSHLTTRLTLGIGLTAVAAAILVGDAFLAGTSIPLQVGEILHSDAPFPVQAPGFWALMAVSLLIGCYELCHMLRAKGFPCRTETALAFTLLLVVAAWYDVSMGAADASRLYLGLLTLLVLVTFVLEIGAVERGRRDVGLAAQSVAWTVLTVMTVGLLGMFLAKIRFLSDDPWQGLMVLSLFVGTVKVGDISAYAVGSLIGRHKLTPTLSPKKSYEGLFGALAGGTGAALAIGCLWGGFGVGPMLVFGFITSAAGVVGDLAESLLKRACGVKDSGAIPGFGGVLDILDSLLGAAPVAYLLLVVLIRQS
jgi:phosphatidate cytidylyltransferase